MGRTGQAALGGGVRVEVTDDPAAFRSREWADLVDGDPAATFFHAPAYLKLWWEEFGSGSLLLALARGEEGPVGACGFEVVERELRFLGGFDVTDYLGPVGSPGLEAVVAPALVEAVETGRWTTADLRGLPEDGPWLGALETAATARGLAARRLEDGVAPGLHLPASFEAYLSELPPKLRHELRRKDRRLRGGVDAVRVVLSTADTLPGDLDRFIDLHRASPGPKGKFMHAGMEMFFRRLGEAFLPSGRFRLAFLEVDGAQVAGAIGLAFGDTFSLYNSAFDRSFADRSPGIVLVAELIRLAIEEGRGRFDLLKGDLGYKYRFGPTPRPIGRLVLTRT